MISHDVCKHAVRTHLDAFRALESAQNHNL